MEEIIDDEAEWDADPNPEMVRWQPAHHSVRTGPDIDRTGLIRADAASALGFVVLGSVAVGALAVGALAIGAVAIGKLFVHDAHFRRLQVDELVIGKVRWTR